MKEFLPLLYCVLMCAMVFPARPSSQWTSGWVFVEVAEDVPPDSDSDSVPWYRQGTGSCQTRAYKDFHAKGRAKGSLHTTGGFLQVTGPLGFAADVVLANEATVSSTSTWKAKTKAFFEEGPWGTEGAAIIEGDGELIGWFNAKNYPSSFGVLIKAIAECDLFVDPDLPPGPEVSNKLEVEQNKNLKFTKDGAIDFGVDFTMGGETGPSLGGGVSGSGGHLTGSFVSGKQWLEKIDVEDDGAAETDTFELEYDVFSAISLTAGEGFANPGEIWADLFDGLLDVEYQLGSVEFPPSFD